MTEEQLKNLTLEEKMKVTRYLIGDMLSDLLEADADIANKARHNISSFAMLFSNLQQLISSSSPTDAITLKAMAKKFGYKQSQE